MKERDPHSSVADNERNTKTSDESDATLSQDPPTTGKQACVLDSITKAVINRYNEKISESSPVLTLSLRSKLEITNDDATPLDDSLEAI